MIIVRLATNSANKAENTIMVPVRRLPREARPSAPFRLTTPVPDAISVPKPVP